MVGEDVRSVGQVHEQQPADHRVEKLVVHERARIALTKNAVGDARRGPTLFGSGE
jgi:hypothetical protein